MSDMTERGPIRVCYIATGADLGGAPRSLLEMIEALVKTGAISPFVILRIGGMLEERLDELGIPYKVMPFPSSIRPKRIPALVKIAAERVAEMRLANFIGSGKFDVVHNNGILYGAGLRAAQRVGLPTVCHVREFAQAENGLTFLREKQVRETIRNSSHVIYISKGVAERFEGWALDGRWSVIHDGIHTNQYLRDHNRLFSQGTCKLLLAGHIMPTKGQAIAIKAVCELRRRGRSIALDIVGMVKDEVYMRRLEKMVEEEEATNSVRFEEFTDDLSMFRAWADISLMCSTANEGLGRVTIEGMLAGCLAVGSDVGGISEVIEHGVTGMLYRSDDYSALADCIELAIDNPGWMNRIAMNGRSYAVENFDSEKYAEKILQLYKDLLN